MKRLLLPVALFSLLLALSPSRAQTTYVPEPGGEKKQDPALADVPDQPGLPRVLLIGDSISVGYTPLVRERLKGKANVHRANENTGPTILGVAHLNEYLAVGTPAGEAPRKWDVIHFNFGLHDIKLMGGTEQVPPTQYQQNLEKIAQMLKATGAKLIFATTTPIPDSPDLRPPRHQSDVLKYNQIATQVMTENNIQIDDLYSAIKPQEARLQVKNNVHFSRQGYQVLATSVAASVEKALGGN